MSTIPPISNQALQNQPTDHPLEFTDIIHVEADSYTGETIEVAINPRVYRDDPNCPYDPDLDTFIHTNSQSECNYISVRHSAIYLNDRRYDDPAFRQHQVERLLNPERDCDTDPIPERYWILVLCENEINEYLRVHGNPSSDAFMELARISRQNQIENSELEERQKLEEARQQYEIDEAARIANLDPLTRTAVMADKLVSATINNSIKLILDFAGKEGDPAGERRRTIARYFIDTTTIVGASFFFRNLLVLALK